MFTTFVIKNFRGIPGLHVKELRRINLIAGMNNTGKTALLEAIHLHNNPADCELPFSISKARGFSDPEWDADIVEWLFWGRNAASGLEVSSWDDKGITRTLTMYLPDPGTFRERFPDAVKQINEAAGRGFLDANEPGLVLKYQQTNEPERVSIGAYQRNGFLSMDAKIPWKIASIYLNSGIPDGEQEMKHFGELEAAKRQDEILPALQILEPRLQRLSLVPLAGMSVIHGDIGLPRLVPMPFMGEGVRRVLSFVMAIANASGGVVLIDEIENGLHYSVMKDVWKAVTFAARGADVQVFATTHSWECIRSAHESFSEGDIYDLRLIRLDRQNNGEIGVAAYDQEVLEYALDMAHEVR